MTLRRFLFALLSCLPLAQPAASAAEKGAAVTVTRESYVSGGRTITVDTFAPARPGRYPAVLVLYTSAGKLAGMRDFEGFSRSLAEHGMVALLVDYFDRTGTLFAGDWTIGRHLHVWEDTVIDAIDFASAHPRVRRDSIGIFGYSLGAFLAVSVASRDARVDAVAEVAGGLFTYLGGRLRRVPPTLILHGTADRRVDIRYARELERVARSLGTRPLVQLYPGEKHVLSATAMADARARSLAFFSRNLQRRR